MYEIQRKMSVSWLKSNFDLLLEEKDVSSAQKNPQAFSQFQTQYNSKINYVVLLPNYCL